MECVLTHTCPLIVPCPIPGSSACFSGYFLKGSVPVKLESLQEMQIAFHMYMYTYMWNVHYVHYVHYVHVHVYLHRMYMYTCHVVLKTSCHAPPLMYMYMYMYMLVCKLFHVQHVVQVHVMT